MRSARSSRPSCSRRLFTFAARHRAQVDAVGATLGCWSQAARSLVRLPRCECRRRCSACLKSRTRGAIRRLAWLSRSARPGARGPRGELGQRGGRARRTPAPPPPGRPASTPTRCPAPASPASRRAPCPASTTHGRSASSATCGDAVRHLAGAAGVVEGALAGDHQVGGAGPVGEPDRRRRPARSRAPGWRRARAARSRARPPPRRPSRGRAGGPAPRRTARATRRTTGSRSSVIPFCGPKILVAPNSPVSGLSTSLAATSRTEPTRSRAAATSTEVTPSRPAPPASRGTSAVAPSAASSPAPPSLVPLPPSPTTTVAAPASTAAATSSPTPYVVASSAPSLAGQVQPARLRALDVRRVADHQHRGRRRRPVRPADRDREQLAAQRLVQHVDEAGAAVGHRRQVELVVRRGLAASPRRSPRRPRPR